MSTGLPRIKQGKRHRMSYSSEYRSWEAMKRRCLNPNAANYAAYGGKGVTIQESWHHFENFIADMGPKPGKGYSIDRIDNNGNYTKENCRWATQSQQSTNQRKPPTRFIYQGERRSLKYLADLANIPLYTMRHRLYQAKWSVERAMTEPLQFRKSQLLRKVQT